MATIIDSIIRDNNLTREQAIYFAEYVQQRDWYEMWMSDCDDDELAIRMADRASTIAFTLEQLARDMWALDMRELYKPMQRVHEYVLA